MVALKLAISLLQDYQKLRERGDKDNGRIRAILIRFAKEILSSRPPIYPSPDFIEETISAINTCWAGKIDKLELVKVADKSLGYNGLGTKMTPKEIDKMFSAIVTYLEGGKE